MKIHQQNQLAKSVVVVVLAGSTSGARQKGTIAKRKGSGVEMTGLSSTLA